VTLLSTKYAKKRAQKSKVKKIGENAGIGKFLLNTSKKAGKYLNMLSIH